MADNLIGKNGRNPSNPFIGEMDEMKSKFYELL